jgi:hypothetical protein
MAKRANKKFEVTSFDVFWEQIYPRREGKLAAQKRWESMKLGPLDLIPIKNWVDKAMLSEQWRETRFIPHAATFLNQKRWVDSEPPPQVHIEPEAHANGEPRVEHGSVSPEGERAIRAFQAREREKYEAQRRANRSG